jgi:hypothetical protein
MSNSIEVGMNVAKGDFTGVVVSIAKGWVKVEKADGTVFNARAHWLSEVDADADAPAVTMSKKLAEAKKRYVAMSINGRTTYNNGDKVARALHGLDAEGVYMVWSKLSGENASVLRDKYMGLNEGAKRMNAGNRIRHIVRENPVLADML